MSNENRQYTTILIKRRVAGNPGPPESLQAGEMAFNEEDGKLYIGTQTSSVSAEEF